MNRLIKQYMDGTLKIKQDELTAVERYRLLAQGKKVDRLPCAVDSGETLAPLIGISVDHFYHSSEKMVEVEEYVYRTFHSDGMGLSTTLRGMAEAMGSEIRYFDNNISQLQKPALSSLDEAETAKKIDVDTDGRLHIILDGLKVLKEKYGNEVPVGATVTGPFTVAAMVVGTEKLLMGMVQKPEKVKALMEIIAENNNRYIKRLIDMKIGIGFADPVSSTSLLREKQYREFSFPYIKKNVDFIRSQGASAGLHICGKSRKIWEDVLETGISAFSLDNIEDLAEAKEVMGDKVSLSGNIPPVEVLRYGTPEMVLESGRQCIRKAWNSPKGFTLTSGCQTPMGTPIANLTALMDCARIFGRYPIDEELLAEE